MGFYGKVANSNKTAFSFDKTYASRREMDEFVSSDNIFIGRYVLVEYDEPPISGYYNGTSFFSAASFYPQTIITPRVGVVYQDLLRSNSRYSFYTWDGSQYTPLNSDTGYAAHYNQDVYYYGRGYDSTAWMKTYDAAKNTYRYVLVAELNTVVPNFHLVYDAPSNIPTAPYFDRDTTNVDYYLHAQASWGHGVRLFSKTKNSDNQNLSDVINGVAGAESDEEILYTTISWHADINGNQYYDRVPNNRGWADIYYNKKGFDPSKHSMASDTIKNTINYSYDKSGRLYGGGLNDQGTAWNSGSKQTDMMEWYVHLPAIGNAICTVYDTLYGFDNSASDKYRYTALATQRSDPAHLVTYNLNSVYGIINRMKDLIGWEFVQKSNSLAVNSRTVNVNDTQKLYYTLITSPDKSEPVIDKYFYYAYDPLYVEATKNANGTFSYQVSSNETITGTVDDVFYLDTDGNYKHPNMTDWPATMSDGTTVGTQYQHIYLAQPRWKLIQMDTPAGDTIGGLILQLHKFLGDGCPNIRDESTVMGCINLLKDTIANVDRHLAPHKIVVTNSGGKIVTSNTEYPYFASMSRTINNVATKYQEVLNSNGEWHLPVWYRLYTLSLKNSSNSNRYFAASYFGNSARHELVETDTLGDAFLKISEDLADASYITPEVLAFTASAGVGGNSYNGGTKIENGRNITDVTLSYTMNKGERQNIKIERINPSLGSTVYNHDVANNYHLDGSYESTKSKTVHDTNTITASGLVNAILKWRLTYKDERDAIVTKEVTMQYMNKVYWGVGASLANASGLSSYASWSSHITGGGDNLQTTVNTTFTVTGGSNQYIFFACPATMTPRFEVCGIEGGFIKLGEVSFTNQSGYATTYAVYRTVRPALGKSEVVVKEG